MTVNPSQAGYTPAHVAKLIDTGAHNVRRWAEWHSEHLSQAANPGQDRPRRFDLRDVEVLRSVKELRDQGLQTEAINKQLSQLTFAVVETDSQPSAQDAPPAAQDSILATSAPIVGIDSQTALQAFVGRLDAIERAQKDRFTWFLYGFLACGVIFGLMLLLAVLFGR